jgi:hypothetical protein
MLLPALLIALFVGTVGTLMFIGWRHRPPLEIPPRLGSTWELPPAYQRRRMWLLVIRLTAFVIGMAGYFGFRALGWRNAATVIGVVAAAVWFGALALSLGSSIVMARHSWKQQHAMRQESTRKGPRSRHWGESRPSLPDTLRSLNRAPFAVGLIGLVAAAFSVAALAFRGVVLGDGPSRPDVVGARSSLDHPVLHAPKGPVSRPRGKVGCALERKGQTESRKHAETSVAHCARRGWPCVGPCHDWDGSHFDSSCRGGGSFCLCDRLFDPEMGDSVHLQSCPWSRRNDSPLRSLN